MLLERRYALAHLLALRPDLERLSPEAGGVAVGMDRGAVGDRLAQRGQRAGRIARRQPVAGDLARVAAGADQLVGDRTVQRPAAQPRDVLVDGVAHERVTELGAAFRGLDEQAGAQQLRDPRLPGQTGDDGEIHARPGDRRDLRGGAAAVAQRRHADEDGVAHGRGERDVAVERQLQPGVAGRQAPGLLQRRRELLDEER